MYDFRGKRALVTGGGTGIGRGISLELAKLGAEVIIMGRRKECLTSVEEENPNIRSICIDITNFDEVREAVEKVLPIHFLVNNAGRGKLASALEATLEDFDWTFDLNVKALINLTQIVAKDLVTRKEKGTVVNVSSQASFRSLPGHLVYCSSKAAVDMVTKVFASELGPHGIRVNSVNPTVVMTDMGRKGWSDPVKADRMLGRIPQGRFAEISEVVSSVIFLLSDQSEMINGHSLPVDGGFLSC